MADCTAEDFDALLIPGGTSPDRIRTDREVQRFVREFDTVKKPMFSIGHGAQVLISSQIVRGRQITGVHLIADDIRNAGGLIGTSRRSRTPTGSRARQRRSPPIQPRDVGEARDRHTGSNRIVTRERFAVLAQGEKRNDRTKRDLNENRSCLEREEIGRTAGCAEHDVERTRGASPNRGR